MRLNWLLLLPAAAASIASALAIQKRDADFFNVRTHMHKDMSGRRGDPVDKYFRECACASRENPIGVPMSSLRDHANILPQMKACKSIQSASAIPRRLIGLPCY